MQFREAYFELLNGKKIKLPSWKGYWYFKNHTIMIHDKDGNEFDIRKTDNVPYTFSNIASNDWEVVKEETENNLNNLPEEELKVSSEIFLRYLLNDLGYSMPFLLI